VDLLPTLLRRTVCPPSTACRGRPLRGHRRGLRRGEPRGEILEALRTRRGNSEVKVITANAGNPRGLPEVELFRVDQDPGERVNLARNSRPSRRSPRPPRLLERSGSPRRGRGSGDPGRWRRRLRGSPARARLRRAEVSRERPRHPRRARTTRRATGRRAELSFARQARHEGAVRRRSDRCVTSAAARRPMEARRAGLAGGGLVHRCARSSSS